jgi:hypothetical protein
MKGAAFRMSLSSSSGPTTRVPVPMLSSRKNLDRDPLLRIADRVVPPHPSFPTIVWSRSHKG